jgi:hypothetical protein
MNLAISNETFMTSYVQAYNFEAYCFTMIDNVSLTMLQINFLIVVYLEECPSVQSPLVRFFEHFFFFSSSLVMFLTLQDC